MHKILTGVRTFAALAFATFTVASNAQTASVTNVSVTSTAKTVNTGSTINALNGTSITATYTFAATIGTSDREPSNPTFTYRINNGVAQNGTIRLSGNSLSIGAVNVPLNSVGEYKLSYTISYQYKVYSGSGENQTVSTQTRTLTGEAPKTVKVWEKPAVTLSAPTPNSVVTGTAVNANVSVSGGNSTGWSYNWTADGSSAGTGSSMTFSAQYKGSANYYTAPIQVTAQNVGPDGSTVWFTQTLNTSVNAYPTPSVTYPQYPSAMFAGDAITLDVQPTGGNPSDWRYNWNNSAASTKTYTYTAQNNGTQPITVSVPVVVKNYGPNGAEWFTQTHTYDFTVYPKPTIALTAPMTDAFEGETLTFASIVAGGQSGKWTYEWYVDGQKQSSTNPQLNYTTIFNNSLSGASRTATIRVFATNNADGVALSATVESQCNITIWRTPGLTAETQTPIGAYSGNSLTLKSITEYGYPSGWSYAWTRNNVAVSNSNSNSLVVTENVADQTEFTYIITATNRIDATQQRSSQNQFRVVYYPSPIANIICNRNAMVSGENTTISATTSGGQDGKWTYEWTFDGQRQSSTEPTINFNAVNTGTTARTTAITCTIRNNADYVSSPYQETFTKEITIYPAANAQLNKPTEQAAFSGEQLEMQVATMGGNPDGWRLNMIRNGENILSNSAIKSLNSYYSNPTVSTTTTESYSVTLTNTIEGNEVYNQTFDYSFTFYPTPEVNFELPNGRTNWVLNDEISLEATTAGGSESAWNYSWSDGAGHTSSNKNFIFNTSKTGNSTISLTATNAPHAIVRPYTNAVEHEITVWPIPQSSISQPYTQAVFSGQDVTISVNATGGLPTGWVYSWTRDGAPISETGATLTENFSVSSKETHTYAITITNTMDGVEVYNQTLNCEAVIYPAASVSFSLPNGRTNWVEGDEISVIANINGGDSDAWSYNWNNGAGMTATTQDFTFNATNGGEAGKICNLSLQASNSPDYILEAYTHSESVSYVVWNTPLATMTVPQTQAVFSGQSVTLSVATEGGLPGGWAYSWTRDGAPIEGTNSLTQSFDVASETSHEYALHVTNTMDGVEVYSADFQFEIVTYPTPTASFSLPVERTAYMTSENVEFTSVLDGGNPDSWNLTWTIDDDDLGSKAQIVSSRFNDSGQHTIKLTAVNSPANILSPALIEYEQTITVYTAGSISSVSESPRAAFSTQGMPFNVEVADGYPKGWSYRWTIELPDGSQMDSSSTSKSYTYAGEATTNESHYTIRCRVRNTLDDIDFFDETQEFQAIYYPTPDIDLVMPTGRTAWMNGEDVNIATTIQGGNPSAWTYVWTLDNESVSGNEEVTIDAENTQDDDAKIHTIKLVATNSPENILEPFVKTLTREITVWPTPSFSAITAKDVAAFSGDAITFKTDTHGGVSGQWTTTWSYSADNGTTNNEETSGNPVNEYVYTQTSDQIVTGVITVNVVNTLDGTPVFSKSLEFNATHYPTPLATDNFANLRDNWMNNEEIEMTRGVFGGESSSWSTQWLVDGQPISTSALATYTAENTEEVDSREHTLELRIINNPENILKPYEFTDSKVITVWPSADIEEQQNAPAYYNGQEVNIGVLTSGGDPSKWSFEWTLDGENLNSATEAFQNFNTVNTETAPNNTHVYTVTARNTLDGTVVYTKQATFTIQTYLTPEAGIETALFNLYFGDEVTFRAEVAGGNPDGWSYSWNTTPVSTTTPDLQYTAEERDADDYTDSRTVTVTNTYGELVWYERQFTVDVNVWKYPVINIVALSTEDYNAEADLTLRTTQTGGDKSAWTYSWTLNGKQVTGADQSSLKVDFENNGSELVTLIYELTAVNQLQNHDEYTKTMSYELRVWPRIHLDSEIDIPTPQIRQDNTFNAYTKPMPSGGYEYTWDFNWKVDGNELSTDPDVEYIMTMHTTGEAMQTEQHTYTLHVANPGPNGRAWQEKDCTPKTITVYRRPRTPLKLERKGNGTTHTLLAMLSDLDDAQLAENAYTFTFGYTDNSGADHSLGNGTARYAHIDSDIFNNSSNQFWVYTLWNYSDGSLVTSGRRYLSGQVDELFDASIYSEGGRGPQAGLNEVAAANDGIFTDGYAFAIDVATPCDVRVRIFTTSGMMVVNQEYPQTSKMKATLGLEKLVSGNYIVEISAGKNHKTIKASTGRFNR